MKHENLEEGNNVLEKFQLPKFIQGEVENWNKEYKY